MFYIYDFSILLGGKKKSPYLIRTYTHVYTRLYIYQFTLYIASLSKNPNPFNLHLFWDCFFERNLG